MKKKKVNKLIVLVFGALLVVVVFYAAMGVYMWKHLTINMTLPGGMQSLIGTNLSVPKKYAKLLSVYPGSRIFSVIEDKQNVAVGTRIQEPDVHKVFLWYQAELVRLGYTISSVSEGDVSNIWFDNDIYKGSVTLSNIDRAHPGKTTPEIRVSLWLESATVSP